MTESAATGTTTTTTTGVFDLKAAKQALSSSSTETRITELRAIDDKISHKGEWCASWGGWRWGGGIWIFPHHEEEEGD